MRSKYTEHFASRGEKCAVDSEILKFKPIRELPCSRILTVRALQYLDRWTKIDSDSEYKTAVLATLRSIHSVIEIKHAIPTTTKSTEFKWIAPRHASLTAPGIARQKYDPVKT